MKRKLSAILLWGGLGVFITLGVLAGLANKYQWGQTVKPWGQIVNPFEWLNGWFVTVVIVATSLPIAYMVIRSNFSSQNNGDK